MSVRFTMKDLALSNNIRRSCPYWCFSQCVSMGASVSVSVLVLQSVCQYWCFSQCVSIGASVSVSVLVLQSVCHYWCFNQCVSIGQLLTKIKVPPQLNVFASLISNSFCKNSKLPSIHCNTPVHLRNFFIQCL